MGRNACNLLKNFTMVNRPRIGNVRTRIAEEFDTDLTQASIMLSESGRPKQEAADAAQMRHRCTESTDRERIA